MKASIKAIALDLARKNKNCDPNLVDSAGFPIGYGATSQQVLMRAFYAAYTGKNPLSIDNSLFPTIPLPNWRVTYDGLIKMDFFKQYFKTFTIGHAYRSTYNISAYNTDISYREENAYEFAKNTLNNYVPKYDVNSASFSEQFAPLFNIDMTWQNNIMTKVELKKSRDVSLSLNNNQINELTSNEISVGMGYRLKDLMFKVKSGGNTKEFKSDLNILASVSIRTNKTALRKIVEDINQVSSGQKVISINTSADYQLSKRLTIRLFFDRIISNPFVSAQFPNSSTNAGVSLKFSLSQ